MSEEETKRKSNKFIRNFIVKKLTQYLGKYLSDIKETDIEAKLGTSSSVLTWYNIQLRKDALAELRLPVHVHHTSNVDKLTCNLHLSFHKSTFNVYVKGIRAFVSPERHEWTREQWREYKSKTLEEWEKTQQNTFQEKNSKERFQRIKHMLMKNTNLKIEDFLLYFDDSEALGYPCRARVYAQELKVDTTNENWVKAYSSTYEFTYRKMEILNFSVALICEKDFRSTTHFSERFYVIRPCKITVKYKVNHVQVPEAPEFSVKIEINDISVSLNELQYHFIMGLLNLIEHKNNYNTYEELRPAGRISGNEKDWWQYLIKSAKKDLKLNIPSLIEMKIQRDKYVDHYKRKQNIIHAPWLKHIDENGERFIRNFEEVHTLNEIIKFRTLALYQLRIEAMSFVKARGNVLGRTHLGDLWDYYLNDFQSLLGDPYEQVAYEREIELTSKEKDELNCLLNMDELGMVNSYLNGLSTNRNDLKVQVALEVSNFSFYLQSVRATSYFPQPIFKREGLSDFAPIRPKHSYRSSDLPDLESYEEVFEVIKAGEDGRAFDPRAVQEHTLLMLNVSKVTGKFIALRDKQVYTEVPLEVKNYNFFDPLALSLGFNMQNFQKFYGYKNSNIIEDIVEQGLKDLNRAHALRFYAQEANLLPEVEFLIHFKEILEVKKPRLCICGLEIDTPQELLESISNQESFMFMGLPQRTLTELKSGNLVKNFEQVYRQVIDHMQTEVLPYFLRANMRWLTKNSSYKEEKNLKAVTLKFGLKGLDSPLHAEFVERTWKRREERPQVFKPKHKLEVTAKQDIDIGVTTETLVKIFQWTTNPPTGKFNGTHFHSGFLKTLQSPKQFSVVYQLLKNSKKSPSFIFHLLKDALNKNKFANFEVKVHCLRFFVIDWNLLDYKKEEFEVTVELRNICCSSESKGSNYQNQDFFSNSSDKKELFYSVTRVRIANLSVKTENTLVLDTAFNLKLQTGLIKQHPRLPEVVLDCNFPYLKLNVVKELVTLLGLLSRVEVPQTFSEYSESQLETIKMQQFVFEANKRTLKENLEYLHNHHYVVRNAKYCKHCLLAYRKFQKVIHFSVGESNSSHELLEIRVFGDSLSRKPFIELKSFLVFGHYEEKVFRKDLRIYTTAVDARKPGSFFLKVIPSELESTPVLGVNEVSSASVRSLGIKEQNSTPLFLVVNMKQKNNLEIFDIQNWLSDFEGIKIHISKVSLVVLESLEDSGVAHAALYISSIIELINFYKKHIVSPMPNLRTPNSCPLNFTLDLIDFRLELQKVAYLEVSGVSLHREPDLAKPQKHSQDSSLERIKTKLHLSCKRIEARVEEVWGGLYKINLVGKTTFEQVKQMVDSVEYFGYVHKITNKLRLNVERLQFYKEHRNFVVSPCDNNLELSSADWFLKVKSLETSKSFTETRSETKKLWTVLFNKTGVLAESSIIKELVQNLSYFFTGKLLKTEFGTSIARNPKIELLESRNFNVRVPKAILNLTYKGTFISQARIEGLDLEVLKEKSQDHDKLYLLVDSLEYVHENSLHKDTLLSTKHKKGIKVNAEYDSSTKELLVKVHNAQVLFVNKMIREMQGFLEVVSNEPSSEKEQKHLFLVVQLKNTKIILPKTSYDTDFVCLDLKTAEIKLHQDQTTWEVPQTLKKPLKTQKLEVPVQHSGVTKRLPVTKVQALLNCVKASMQVNQAQVTLGEVGVLHLNCSVPTTPNLAETKWELKNQLGLTFQEAKLKTSVGRILQMQQMIESNVDEEETIFNKSKSVWKNTKMHFEVKKSQVTVKKWITLPKENSERSKETRNFIG